TYLSRTKNAVPKNEIMVTEKEIDEKYALPDDVENIYWEAYSAINESRCDDARRLLSLILDKYPDQPRVLNALASTFRKEGDYEKAEEVFFRAIAAAPDYIYAYNNLSLMYSVTGEMEKAAEYARRSIKLLKGSAVPWHTLGMYYMVQGQFRTALDHFLAAYSYDPGYAKAAYNAACCYARLGETNEALNHLAKSLDSPERIAKAEADEDFAGLREMPEFKEIIEKAKKAFREP
ncbi:MAG: tetratricopeptide repeat protein, partial [Candidatus Coatesbacteria bacterium]